MPDARVVQSIQDVGRDDWDHLFPGQIETWDYLCAVEAADLPGFRLRYVLVADQGRLVCAAPMFVTDYPLDTTLGPAGRKAAEALTRIFPRALTLGLACLGSPCTETLTLGFAPDLSEPARIPLAHVLLRAFEAEAAEDGCSLLGIKDAPEDTLALWDAVAGRAGYGRISGLPVAWLPIDFPDRAIYLAQLSSATRKDMRRKLKSEADVRIEVRSDLSGVLDRVMHLYRQTRARAEMTLEDLTPAYFEGVGRTMPGRVVYVLYWAGDLLVGVNLLLRDNEVLIDKFFCMDAERGRALNLYFLSWFRNIDYCLEHGLTRYQSGQAAYEVKLRLGSRLIRTAMLFRHRNPLVNGALRLAAPLFAADPTLEMAA